MDPVRARTALHTHLQGHLPDGVTLTFAPERGGTPAPTLPEDHPLLLTAFGVQQALHGRPPVVVRSGGTLPISAIFREMLGIGTLAYGLAMPDEDVHAPNEFFRLSSLDEGLRSWPLLLEALGQRDAAEFQPFRHPVAP